MDTVNEQRASGGPHTFVVCAYGESPFLEECLCSLQQQELKTNVLIATHTPNSFIEGLAEKYGYPLFVNEGEGGIAQDWNYALSCAKTRYVTIAHQDDVYCPRYALRAVERMDRSRKPLLYFTNYAEIRKGEVVESNNLLKTKRKMLLPLSGGKRSGSIFWRRRILSLGSAICCPSVTMDTRNIPNPPFTVGMRSNLDWLAWEEISKLQGDFLYDPEILMYHRIHEGSETSATLADNERFGEDLLMFKKFWPAPVAALINRVYSKSADSNNLTKV